MEVPTAEEQEKMIFRDLFGVERLEDINGAGFNEAAPMNGFAPDEKRMVQMCLPAPSNVLGHIRTDKPIYKQNDLMFIEVLLINPISKKPFGGDKWSHPYSRMEIKDQFDTTVFKSESENY
mmetsp:Transcript_11766/g.18041  ORF Transcript_11766/g.18041 Transcript_11766/m.18041 type:complete len:121 (-) Transcript_11766:993-1355(-)